MGRYSDSEDERKNSRRKRHRRSRSRSNSSTYSSSHRSKKSKRSKRHRRSRSRSSSSSTSYRRRNRRSRSRNKRSRSRDRRSRSRTRRSRSRDRRSCSRDRRSRSRDRRSHSRDRRSHSRGRRSRSRSQNRSRRKRKSRSLSRERVSAFITPSFSESDKANLAPEDRLQKALEAAAAADKQLKTIGVLDDSVLSNRAALSLAEHQKRAQAIESIESESFTQSSFKSSKEHRSDQDTQGVDSAHDSAIFNTFKSECSSLADKSDEVSSQGEPEGLMHSNLYISQAKKMDRWLRKLATMRRKKLEGQVMA